MNENKRVRTEQINDTATDIPYKRNIEFSEFRVLRNSNPDKK
jgi:hypothetical protein